MFLSKNTIIFLVIWTVIIGLTLPFVYSTVGDQYLIEKRVYVDEENYIVVDAYETIEMELFIQYLYVVVGSYVLIGLIVELGERDKRVKRKKMV